MTKRAKFPITFDVEITPEMAAQAFADMNDDEQAQFFVNAARIAAETYEGSPQSQWIRIGDHLATCKCSSDAGRELIRSIQYGMDHPMSKPEPVDLIAKASG